MPRLVAKRWAERGRPATQSRPDEEIRDVEFPVVELRSGNPTQICVPRPLTPVPHSIDPLRRARLGPAPKAPDGKLAGAGGA